MSTTNDEKISKVEIIKRQSRGAVDAVCFTTAVQVCCFFQYVKNHGCYFEIVELAHYYQNASMQRGMME